MPETNAVVFMKQLLFAVHYLHYDCGLLHRDIKPGFCFFLVFNVIFKGNILLSHEMTVKLADFGFCCSIRELDLRSHHTICGTPNYVPMEVIDKWSEISKRNKNSIFGFSGHSVYSEYWAIACTFYSMLFGRPPFHSETLEATYARIRRCDYVLPERYPPVSEKAKDLISRYNLILFRSKLIFTKTICQSKINNNCKFKCTEFRTLIRDCKRRLCIDEMLSHPALNQYELNFFRGSQFFNKSAFDRISFF